PVTLGACTRRLPVEHCSARSKRSASTEPKLYSRIHRSRSRRSPTSSAFPGPVISVSLFAARSVSRRPHLDAPYPKATNKKPSAIIYDQLRIEARLAVARHVDRQFAGVGRHGLAAVAVAPVASLFGQRLLQRFQQAALIKSCTGVTSRQQQL